jgi:hypothetical protein
LKNPSKLIFAALVVAILIVTVSSTQFTATASAQQATGQTTILGTCGLSFPNGNNVNYGSLVPNTISAEKKLNMTNSGTVSSVLEVKGTNWKDSGSNSIMFANRTYYNVTSSTYLQKIPLQVFDQTVTNAFMPATILQTFWQLQTILINPSFTGTVTQTMNFTVSCQPITIELTPIGAQDGFFGIQGSSCSTGSLGHRTEDTSDVSFGPRLWDPNLSSVGCYRAWMSWDTSSIPDGAEIIDVDLKFQVTSNQVVGFPNGPRSGTVYSLEHKPEVTSFDVLRTDIRNGTQYVADEPIFGTLGTHTIDLGTSADTDLKVKLGMNWFGIGLSHPDETTNSFKNTAIASSENIGSVKPTLIVTYIP